jgi:hypothetical protein
LTQQDLEQMLDDKKILYDSLNLKKKSEDNVFAFVEISDSESFQQLLNNGLKIDGKKIRAYVS